MVLEMSEVALSGYSDGGNSHLEASGQQDAAPSWFSWLNIASAVLSSIARYSQRAAFEQLDEYLIEDIGIESGGSLGKSRRSAQAFRRVWLASCGRF